MNETKIVKSNKHKPSRIYWMHCVKLVYRSALFVLALVFYVLQRVQNHGAVVDGMGIAWWVLLLAGIVYMIEMIARLFPSKLDSMGCGKQFKKHYQPTGETDPQLRSWKSTLAVAAAWFALNGAIGALYYTHVIDQGILLLISLAYGICDMICVLFFCPFQTWFMKNRCCATCRIYNWDYFMIFTPCLFLPHGYTWSLLGMSLIILLRWELTVRIHPKRFSERTNGCTSCKNCEEKLCQHKKQLKGFWRKNNIKK